MAKKVGLALSGGGARGFAHIGVLKVLAENDIPIDMIAGTSAGAIVGAAYAAGMTVDEIVKMAGKVRYRNLLRPSVSPRGIFSNAPMGKFLAREIGIARFEQLNTPFAAVAYDIEAGKEVVFKDSGDLITAILASCAVPGIFTPVNGELGHLLVDGGVISPMPVDAVFDLGADVVVAVDLLSCGNAFRKRPRSGFGIAFQSALTLIRVATTNQRHAPDLVIVPAIAHLRPDQINKRDELISLGEDAAAAQLSSIKKLI